MKQAHIIGGGTTSHVRPHLALSAPAYGSTARKLNDLCTEYSEEYGINLHLTRMANSGKGELETNDDVEKLVDRLIQDQETKLIFFNPALTDYHGSILDQEDKPTRAGKYEERLHHQKFARMELTPTAKIRNKIRQERKDIYLVSFKASSGLSQDEQYTRGLDMLKTSSSNLVLANDVKTRTNMIITPEEARYHVTTNREEALTSLVDIAYQRSKLNFTRSTVVDGQPINWRSELVPETLREVVDYCIEQGAYKPFKGKTAGHFAAKIDDGTILTSRRKTNFNDLEKIGLVRVEAEGTDKVTAYGSKPSVGGQSQRIIFKDHPEYDSIVHFHCPIREESTVPTRNQRPYECGSHECGQNTSDGLEAFGKISAVYLDNHGPNIVFNSEEVNTREVIEFIDKNFDLKDKTGGLFT